MTRVMLRHVEEEWVAPQPVIGGLHHREKIPYRLALSSSRSMAPAVERTAPQAPPVVMTQ